MFRVKVERRVEGEGGNYPRWEDVYEQVTENIEVADIAAVVNGLIKPPPPFYGPSIGNILAPKVPGYTLCPPPKEEA